MTEVVKPGELSQTTDISVDTDKTGSLDKVGGTDSNTYTSGATGPITKAISQRRSYRRQWQIFEYVAMIILDTMLVVAAFRLAYYLRFYLLFNSPLLYNIRYNLSGLENSAIHNTLKYDIRTPLNSFLGLEIGIVV